MSATTAFTEKQISKILNSFNGTMATRNKALFVFGLATGFRINEILQVRRKDILCKSGLYKKKISLYCSKGEKSRSIELSDFTHFYLTQWLNELDVYGYSTAKDYIFINVATGAPLSYIRIYQIIKNACNKCNINGDYATHSLRKFFARNTYNYFAQNRDRTGIFQDPLIMTRHALGHKYLKDTEKYLNFMLTDTGEAVEHLFDKLQTIQQKNSKNDSTKKI